MQLQFSFAVLLASVFVVLSTLEGAEARPMRRDLGLITVPLKRLHQVRDDIHPQVLLQQHINRGHKRLARMTGTYEPSPREMRERVQKRNQNSQSNSQSNFDHNDFQGHGPNPIMFDVPEGPSPGSARKNIKKRRADGVGNPSLNKIRPERLYNRPYGNHGFSPMLGTVEDTLVEVSSNTENEAKTIGKGSSSSSAGNQGGPGISPVDVQAAASDGLTPANPPSTSDSLGLDDEANDVGYIATVQMGTPPRDFKLLMDSGSADLWVGAENCQSQEGGGCGTHTFLGPQSSSSFVDTQQSFEVTYGSGQVSGDIITDNLSIAGLPLNNHTFGVATVESVEFSANEIPFDGLMGLAQSLLSEQGVPTPVESLASAGLIPAAVTSFKLGRVADGTNDGEVTFGGLDSSKFNANSLVTFNNVNAQGFWEGAVDSFSVDGQDLGLSGRTAILDTGTTLIIAPPADAAAIHAAIPGAASDGQGGFTIPCTTQASVALTFSGQTFAIDTRDLLFAPVNPNDLTGDCTSGISSGQIGGAEEWLVGDVFLKNVYFSTDVGSNQITLATLA